MKRNILITVLLASTISLFGQSLLDKPAAVVKLVQTEIVSSKKVNQNIAALEANAKRKLTDQEKMSVLNSMVDSVLVEQAAKRANISITDDQVKQYGIAKLSQTVGQNLNEAGFKKIIEDQTKQPVENYLSELKKQLIIQKYITEVGKSDFQSIPEPTEKEIKDAYTKEEMSFVNPEMMRISHIFFSFVANPTTSPRLMNDDEKAKVRTKAEDVLKSLKNGTITFEQAVRTYSEDPQSKGKAGDIGYLVRSDQNAIKTFGQDFIDQVYSMSVGDYKLLESNAGYHIVRVTDFIDKKFLKLDDPVNPVENMTVRQYISQRLYAIKQQDVFQKVSQREVKKLRDEAEITLYKDNLGW